MPGALCRFVWQALKQLADGLRHLQGHWTICVDAATSLPACYPPLTPFHAASSSQPRERFQDTIPFPPTAKPSTYQPHLRHLPAPRTPFGCLLRSIGVSTSKRFHNVTAPNAPLAATLLTYGTSPTSVLPWHLHALAGLTTSTSLASATLPSSRKLGGACHIGAPARIGSPSFVCY
ncbi:hypothetical protein FB45DRAFT_1037983 [Roridomyces roridus]|uniref:Uncharacterized protein n=1 Tax=Roridomyces roridus TaxID=1738132 RepID=A0AAD7B4I4_9AGAR|nr:hypothetical protein FB45DRAFT_1037983 [Roridomyces roridus]